MGVYIGTWRGAGPGNGPVNAVYGSMDHRGRINRRISKEDGFGQPVSGGNYNYRQTACSHEDVNYTDTLRTRSKEEVDQYIRTFLDMMLDAPGPTPQHAPGEH